MTSPMSPERFMELAAAYGGDIGRWPAAERPAAQALAQTADAAGRVALERALADASALDGLLARQPVAAPSAALQDRIEATAPLATARPGRAGGSAGRRGGTGAPWWLPVLGMAGVGAAGVAAGAFAMSFGLAVVQVPAADVWSNSGNAFGVAGQQWGEE